MGKSEDASEEAAWSASFFSPSTTKSAAKAGPGCAALSWLLGTEQSGHSRWSGTSSVEVKKLGAVHSLSRIQRGLWLRQGLRDQLSRRGGGVLLLPCFCFQACLLFCTRDDLRSASGDGTNGAWQVGVEVDACGVGRTLTASRCRLARSLASTSPGQVSRDGETRLAASACSCSQTSGGGK